MPDLDLIKQVEQGVRKRCGPYFQVFPDLRWRSSVMPVNTAPLPHPFGQVRRNIARQIIYYR